MSKNIRLVSVLTLILMFFVAACANSATTGGSTASGSPTASTSKTATPTIAPTVTKPSAVPVTTVPLCESWVSIAEANQILSPPAPIASVDPGNSTGISSCQYLDASSKVPFLVNFESFPPGTQLSTFAAEAAAKALNGVTITVNEAVSGVGDQAWYIVGTAASGTLTAHGNVLYVADGSIVIIIENLDFNNSAPLGSTDDTTVLNEFTQIANLIISRI